jgi:hypothetical protein
MSMLEDKDLNVFTDIRTGPNLIVASDYAGECKGDKSNSYSFLACDAIYLWLWHEMWEKTRSKHLPDGRRMSFKKLNDKFRQGALVPFLKAANTIPGVLITFVFHKNTGLLFKGEHTSWKHQWKRRPFEKLLRVAHLFSMIISCLSRNQQEIVWLTDNDEIMANEAKQKNTRSVVMHLLNHYLRHQISWTRFGTPKGLASEDLLAIPDLACGAINELAEALFLAAGQKCNKPKMWEADIQNKAQKILDWYCDDAKHSLKRILVLVWRDPDKKLRHSCIHFSGQARPDYYWHKELMQIMEIDPSKDSPIV